MSVTRLHQMYWVNNFGETKCEFPFEMCPMGMGNVSHGSLTHVTELGMVSVWCGEVSRVMSVRGVG